MPEHHDENARACNHPGLDHAEPWSYCWPCPACGVCKFIGHGPLCGDCAFSPVACSDWPGACQHTPAHDNGAWEPERVSPPGSTDGGERS